jgi:hypothetical protein
MDPDDLEDDMQKPENKTPEFIQDAYSTGESHSVILLFSSSHLAAVIRCARIYVRGQISCGYPQNSRIRIFRLLISTDTDIQLWIRHGFQLLQLMNLTNVVKRQLTFDNH